MIRKTADLLDEVNELQAKYDGLQAEADNAAKQAGAYMDLGRRCLSSMSEINAKLKALADELNVRTMPNSEKVR